MNDNIKQFDDRLNNLANFISRQEGKRDQLIELKSSYENELTNIIDEADLLEHVMILFQKTSEYARSQAKNQIENLVTKCLQYIFESNIEFIIEIEELRNKANAEFYVINDTPDFFLKTKPEQSRGGGVVDIVSLALRISFMQTHKPSIEGPLILDEPAKHVSEEYIYNVGEFLRQSSSMFNRQIIMVTHNSHLAALSEDAYRVELSGTESNVSPVKSL
ncbi:P-loop NTPase family protein [Gudongella sp. SC589]|jgi:DNA repair ATPase RecN|uniref:ATPase n=1 Tax=Gudongella sp. SC589 TaxID=3385990 RepID=UPI003904C0E1